MLRLSAFFLLSSALVTLGQAQMPTLNSTSQSSSAVSAPASVPPPASGVSGSSQNDIGTMLRDAITLLQQKQIDAALAKVNAAAQIAPQNIDVLGLRAGIYAEKKQFDKAQLDYQQIIKIDPTNIQSKFNLAEVSFLLKKYDDARPGFLALQKDPNLGELSTYKVFLCDLFGGHNDLAAKELDAFDKIGSGAGYYFSKAAWYLYQKKPDDARGWLVSAANIYSPGKFKLYSASLFDLGYLPIPLKQKS